MTIITDISCPTCGKTVSKTHRMQTIEAQLTNHLRTHGLTIAEARIKMRQALNQQREIEAEYNRLKSEHPQSTIIRPGWQPAIDGKKYYNQGFIIAT